MYKKKNKKTESASGYIDVESKPLPKRNHPVPRVGEIVKITELMPYQHSMSFYTKECGVYKIGLTHGECILCYHLNDKYEILQKETFRVLDFRLGLLIYESVSMEDYQSVVLEACQ